MPAIRPSTPQNPRNPDVDAESPPASPAAAGASGPAEAGNAGAGSTSPSLPAAARDTDDATTRERAASLAPTTIPTPPASVESTLKRLIDAHPNFAEELRTLTTELVVDGKLEWEQAANLVAIAASRGTDNLWSRQSALKKLVALAKSQDRVGHLETAAKFALTYGDARAGALVGLAAELGVDVGALNTKDFAQAAGRAINAHGAKLLEPSTERPALWNVREMNRAIYGLHEGDGRLGAAKEELGEKLMRELDARGAYALLAGGYEPNDAWAYQVTLAALRREVVASGKSMADLVRDLDPHARLASGVVDTLAQFDATDVLIQGGPVFVNELLKLVAGSGQATIITRALKFFDERYTTLPKDLREQLEAALVSAIHAPTADDNTVSKRAAAAYMLRHLFERQRQLGAAAQTVAGQLPALPASRPAFEDWLADGIVTAHMVFYPNELWYGESITFFEKQGFARRPDLVGELGLEPSAIVLERDRHGAKQRLIITMNDQKVPYRVPDDRTMLVVGGSCGSYGAMTNEDFLLRYGQHHLVADADTGEGLVNNYVMLLLLDGITARKTDWKDFRLHIYEKRSIRPPTDIGFRMGAYSRAFATWSGEKLPGPPKRAEGARTLHSSVDVMVHRGHAADFTNTFPMPEHGEK